MENNAQSDKEALARRAVAAWQKRGLDWMPGMQNTDGERVIVTARGLRLVACDGLAHDQITDVDQPDLDDHATLGCIENGMLPAAWGPEVVLAVARWASESGEVFADIHVYQPLRPAVMLFRAVDTRLAEALVLCLEAAAERREP